MFSCLLWTIKCQLSRNIAKALKVIVKEKIKKTSQETKSISRQLNKKKRPNIKIICYVKAYIPSSHLHIQSQQQKH